MEFLPYFRNLSEIHFLKMQGFLSIEMFIYSLEMSQLDILQTIRTFLLKAQRQGWAD